MSWNWLIIALGVLALMCLAVALGLLLGKGGSIDDRRHGRD